MRGRRRGAGAIAGWVVCAVLAAAVAGAIAKEVPAMRRYWKVERM